MRHLFILFDIGILDWYCICGTLNVPNVISTSFQPVIENGTQWTHFNPYISITVMGSATSQFSMISNYPGKKCKRYATRTEFNIDWVMGCVHIILISIIQWYQWYHYSFGEFGNYVGQALQDESIDPYETLGTVSWTAWVRCKMLQEWMIQRC